MSQVVPLISAVIIGICCAVAIASLVINIIILTNSNTIKTNTAPKPVTPQTGWCPNVGASSKSAGYQTAANYLLSGVDNTVDPCNNFYAFTCNKFLGGVNLEQLGLPRLGTYDQSQQTVNSEIFDAQSKIRLDDQKVSMTERVSKAAVQACLYPNSTDMSKQIYADLKKQFGGVPFLGDQLSSGFSLFGAAGNIEQNHAVGTLMSSWVSVDYGNIKNNALYVSQPELALPHDYYVKPQYSDNLNTRVTEIATMMSAFNNDTKTPADITPFIPYAQGVMLVEVAIAMAAWPDDLMRNYKQQYNPGNLASLKMTYGAIDWDAYLASLLAGVQNSTQYAQINVVLSQPSYFAWLNSVIEGNTLKTTDVVNYIIIGLIEDDAQFIGGIMRDTVLNRKNDHVQYIHRKGRGVTRIGRRYERKFDVDNAMVECINIIMAYMPYGVGYTYVKSKTNRDAVAADVQKQTGMIITEFQKMIQTLGWMTNDTKNAAKLKSDNLIKNFGWPRDLYGNFSNTAKLDAYHQDYASILGYYATNNTYMIMNTLKRGLEVREAMRLLNEGADRTNFLQSPAEVNAWYQPERNSITFPFAAWNPPYYRFDFPQAYNFAGQGGTGGHELTHGYDDEGVQFGPHGALVNCQWNKCGWMDAPSSSGFTDMAQCVVSQFSSQCCPLTTGNVHCANGATTQGENIADLGGQQSAYNAYRSYIQQLGHEEDRLPGMEQYTMDQVFWITYGYSWCMKQSDSSLRRQLLTNPHSPAQCRTNQVMQDIPSFGKDFACQQGSAMYPMPAGRCKVWVGY